MTGERSAALGTIKALLAIFPNVTENIEFHVIEVSSYDMLIGCPTMEKMNGDIDFGKKCYAFRTAEERMVIPPEV